MHVPSRLREGLVQDEHRSSTWHTRGTEQCCRRAGTRGAQIESAVMIQLDHDAPGAGLTTIDSCSSSAGLSIPASTCTVNFCGSSVALAGTPLITPESASRLSPEGRSGEIRKPLSVRWSILRQSASENQKEKRHPPSRQATRQLRLVWLNLNTGSHCVNRALVRRLRVMHFERLGLVNLGALKDDACFPAIRRLAKLCAPSRRAHTH